MYIYKYTCMYGCFQKKWYPPIIRFNRVFHYKSSISGYLYFWKHPSSSDCACRIYRASWWLGLKDTTLLSNNQLSKKNVNLQRGTYTNHFLPRKTVGYSCMKTEALVYTHRRKRCTIPSEMKKTRVPNFRKNADLKTFVNCAKC